MKQGFWLSWADKEGFNGVIIVKATNFLEAIDITNKLKISPIKGGQVQGIEIDLDSINKQDINRLLTKEECKKYV